MNRTPFRLAPLLIPFALALAWFPVSHTARADTCEQGCDFLFRNTVLGQQALINNIGGLDNTAIGFYSLAFNTTGADNTANGSSTLEFNTTGSRNTANGAGALNSNTTGSYNTAVGHWALLRNTIGEDNTAIGESALLSNTTGNANTANGAFALNSNTVGINNTATGWQALFGNTTGNSNTANGLDALLSNTTGFSNTANGVLALGFNTTGSLNTATGAGALVQNTIGINNTATGGAALTANTTGSNNTATGFNALFSNTTGSSNIALGVSAGTNLTIGSNNIDIGNVGAVGESRTIRVGTRQTHRNTYIAGINGVTVPTGVAVIVDANGHLGTTTSSARFKEEIKPMDKASEAILALQPVTFHYIHELDPDGTPQYGLVVEEVEKVDPDLVARDEQGKPYTVRYDAVNAMLLNEFLKEHRRNEDQQAIIERQQKQIKALTEGLQKISAQLELNRFAPQTVTRNQ